MISIVFSFLLFFLSIILVPSSRSRDPRRTNIYIAFEKSVVSPLLAASLTMSQIRDACVENEIQLGDVSKTADANYLHRLPTLHIFQSIKQQAFVISFSVSFNDDTNKRQC